MGAGEFLPMLGMVIVQIGYAGMNITSKLAMDSGMNPFVLVAYRQIFAAIAIIPFALFLERKTRPKITRPVLLQILLCSVFGATGNQIFYFIGLKHSTPTIACALGNVLPAITFILAIPFRLETVGMKSKSGQAKVLGTVVCVGGAMLLSFYHGAPINIGESHIHWKLSDEMRKSDPTSTGGSSILGPFLIIVSCIVWAVWFIIQARLSEKFAAPYTSTALMCFMASIQCVIVGAFAERSVSGWSLSSGIRLIASLYAGIVGSALAFFLMTWCIQRKGPLYVSVFSPLLLVIVAALSWAFLQEKLYVGTVIGSLLIVAGLYTVLWGKDREMISKLNEDMKGDDLEMQFAVHANGKPHPTT